MSKIFDTTPTREKLDHSEENEIYAMFSFNPPSIDAVKRPALDIAVAMDVSSSMAGQKIENAKRSLLKLVEHLSEKDRLSVVSFDSQVDDVLEPTLMSASGKNTARSNIQKMYSRGCTNLSGGLLRALDFLKTKKAKKGTVRKVLIFTDGQANLGISDSDELAQIVLEQRNKIGISSFGYGSDHDAVLLEKIAQDGSFYYIATPDKILNAFGTELGGLISTFAQNVELRLTPADGVEILEIMNDLNVIQDGDTAVIKCEDLLAEQPYHVVLRLKIDERKNAHPRRVKIVHGLVKLFDLSSKKRVEEKIDLRVRFVKPGKEDTSDNPVVMEEVALQRLIKANEEAEIYASQGNWVAAQDVYLTSGAFAASVGTARANSLSSVARGLSVNYASAGSYTSGGRSSSLSSTKMLKSRSAGSGGQTIGGVEMDALYSNSSQVEISEAFASSDNFTITPPGAETIISTGTATTDDVNNFDFTGNSINLTFDNTGADTTTTFTFDELPAPKTETSSSTPAKYTKSRKKSW